MDEPRVRFQDNPVEATFKEGATLKTEDFVKQRYKGDNATVDIALTSIDPDAVETYIEQRKKEIRSMMIDVPSPYTSTIEPREQEENSKVTFQEEDNGRAYGLGHADPEYRLMLEGMGQIKRYRYLITWRYFPDDSLLAEVELFIPPDTFTVDDALTLVDAITITTEGTDHDCAGSCEDCGTCMDDCS